MEWLEEDSWFGMYIDQGTSLHLEFILFLTYNHF